MFRWEKDKKFSTFKAYILKPRRRSAAKKIEDSLINLECSYLFQKHIFSKWVHMFH